MGAQRLAYKPGQCCRLLATGHTVGDIVCHLARSRSEERPQSPRQGLQTPRLVRDDAEHLWCLKQCVNNSVRGDLAPSCHVMILKHNAGDEYYASEPVF